MTTWKHLVHHSKHSKIGIIAHSMGGMVSVQLAEKFKADFEKRVFAVLLTDSAHYGM